MPEKTAPRWRISIDTGGTFTDVVAVDPAGSWQRLKILSDASLRERVVEVQSPTVLGVEHAYPDGLFDGADLRSRAGAVAKILRQRGSTLELQEPIDIASGDPVTLDSPLQAPALAAHWVTHTPVDAPLPVMQLRLATTRATNALLERQGARCALLLTAGLEDLLSIGTQQRPELFAREVRKVLPFAERCVGVQERLASDGSVLVPLDESATREQLEQLRHEGFTSIGIALLHSYRNALHEQRVGALARECGFTFISLSSELSVRQGYLERARGCEINAYLKPVMGGYLDAIRHRLSAGSELLVMSSAAQLLSPARFQPKDGLLSGPAGGVLGAAQAAQVVGVRRALAFDMGGTSTDVARIEDDPELTYRHRVGDAELWAAAVDVETVAAGGGSICTVHEGLPQVGPQSAGAHPGPACYDAGGPLALTDINVLLGRLRPQRFPFALNVEASRSALQRCRQDLQDGGSLDIDEETLLEGFLRVANERMAEAMRRVTLRRGHDPRQHSLVAFGGAGGQHACAIAELLHLPSVVIPVDPGLLSAIGVAAARRAQAMELQLLRPLQDCVGELHEHVQDLSRRARQALQADGVADVEISKLEAELRFTGQESVVALQFTSVDEIEARFLERYEEIHLHRPAQRDIELVTLRATAIETAKGDHSPTGEATLVVAPVVPSLVPQMESTRLFHAGRWHVAKVVQRPQLSPGVELQGPMLVEEQHSAFFLPPGWQATLHDSGALIAHQHGSGADAAVRAGEAIERQLFLHRFESIAKEMGERLRHAAISTNVKERQDFSCAVLDAAGRLVVNAPHIPVHLGALGTCVRAVRQHMQLRPGDFIVTNHPAFGGSHLPDITIMAPVHDDTGALLAHVACRAHHAEIGGIAPGSMPAHATRLVEEGVVLRPLRLGRDGVFDLEPLRRALLTAPYPTRAVEDNLADAEAMLVACRRGVQALRELAQSEGVDRMQQHMHGLRAFAAARCSRALREWGEGTFAATTTLDDASALQVSMQLEDGRAIIDFTGSAPTHPGNLNATPAVVTSCILYVLRLMAGDELPFNEGLLEPVTLVLPRGILSPDFDVDDEASPAIVGGNVETSQRLVDLLLTALGWAACSQGTMNNLSFGNARFGYYETLGGGTGAGPDFHGESAVHSHMTNTRITDVEVLEHRYPVRVRRFLVRRGSGAQGATRGGDGLIRELEFTEPVQLSLLTQHRVFGPAGAAGGADGAAGRQWVQRRDGTRTQLASIAEATLEAGDRIIVETPGGGGWGQP